MKSDCSGSGEEAFLQFLKNHLTLSECEKQTIMSLLVFKTVPKGAMLFNKGALTREYYLVMKGGIRTYLLVDGEEITTEFYTETDALIPTSTAVKQPSNCYATCFEDSIVVVSTEELEQELFRQIPEIESICRRFSVVLFAKKANSLDDYKTLSPEQRYLQLIRERPGLTQRVPQYQLASYLGIRPESLSRIRRRLTQKPRA